MHSSRPEIKFAVPNINKGNVHSHFAYVDLMNEQLPGSVISHLGERLAERSICILFFCLNVLFSQPDVSLSPLAVHDWQP